jgi:hypothetical protein
MAFQEALRHVGADRWPTVQPRLAAALGELGSKRAAGQPGYAADRDQRGRGAARLVKLQMLAQQDASRSALDPAARAQRRLAWSDQAPADSATPSAGWRATSSLGRCGGLVLDGLTRRGRGDAPGSLADWP